MTALEISTITNVGLVVGAMDGSFEDLGYKSTLELSAGDIVGFEMSSSYKHHEVVVCVDSCIILTTDQEIDFVDWFTFYHEECIEYCLPQIQDGFKTKNVPIERIDDPISRQKGLMQITNVSKNGFTDYSVQTIFIVRGQNDRKRLKNKKWLMYKSATADKIGVNEMKFKKKDRKLKTASYRNERSKERIALIIWYNKDGNRFKNSGPSNIPKEELSVVHRLAQSRPHIIKVDNGLMNQKYRDLTNSIKCQLCIDKNKAVNWCDTCGKNICSFCKLFHQKVWDVMDHEILPLRTVF